VRGQAAARKTDDHDGAEQLLRECHELLGRSLLALRGFDSEKEA
jgi:hypothetical protein